MINNLEIKRIESSINPVILENIEYLKQHLDDLLEISDQTLLINLINETYSFLEQAKEPNQSYQKKSAIFEQLSNNYFRAWEYYKNDNNAISIIKTIEHLTNYSIAYFKLFLALSYINEGKTGQYKDDLERVVTGFLLLSETIDVFFECFSISELQQIYESAKHTISISDRNIREYFESELELSNLVTQLRAYCSLIVLKLEKHIEQESSSIDFWESIQQFREKNNLDEEGIEPEEWLKNLRDTSPRREVNL